MPLALKGKAAQRIAVVTELLYNASMASSSVMPCWAYQAAASADQQRRVDSVLVADVASGQVAVALLKAEDIAFGTPLGLQLADLLADELKAGQGAAQLDAVLFATGAAISVETMVVTATGSAGIVPCARRVRQI